MTQEQTNPDQEAGGASQPVPKTSPMQSKLLANIQRGVAGGAAAARSNRFAQAKAVEATTVQAAIADGGSQAAALVQGHPVAGLVLPTEGTVLRGEVCDTLVFATFLSLKFIAYLV